MNNLIQQSPISPTPPSNLNQDLGTVLEMPVQATTDDQITEV